MPAALAVEETVAAARVIEARRDASSSCVPSPTQPMVVEVPSDNATEDMQVLAADAAPMILASRCAPSRPRLAQQPAVATEECEVIRNQVEVDECR